MQYQEIYKLISVKFLTNYKIILHLRTVSISLKKVWFCFCFFKFHKFHVALDISMYIQAVWKCTEVWTHKQKWSCYSSQMSYGKWLFACSWPLLLIKLWKKKNHNGKVDNINTCTAGEVWGQLHGLVHK